jgi:hypothetical protein
VIELKSTIKQGGGAEFNPTEENKWEIKIKRDKVQLRFQQNSWYRTRGHKVELSKTNENDN